MSLLKRLFGKAKPPSDAPSGQVLGEAAILDMLVGRNGFAEQIITWLKAQEGWPFDLGDGTPDAGERVVLNVWGFTLCIRTCFRDVSEDDKSRMIDEIYNWLVLRLVGDKATTEAGAEQALDEVLALRQLTPIRFPEYNTAYNEMRQRKRARDQFAADPLVELILKNLFGRETNSVKVWTMAAFKIDTYQLSFVESGFGTPQGWRAIQNIMKGTGVSDRRPT
jgi:hypothetical protein